MFGGIGVFGNPAQKAKDTEITVAYLDISKTGIFYLGKTNQYDFSKAHLKTVNDKIITKKTIHDMEDVTSNIQKQRIEAGFGYGSQVVEVDYETTTIPKDYVEIYLEKVVIIPKKTADKILEEQFSSGQSLEKRLKETYAKASKISKLPIAISSIDSVIILDTKDNPFYWD